MKLNVPRFEQENDWFCGPAVLQSVLAYYGINKSQKEIATESNATKKYGSFLSDMVLFARKSGLKTNLILFDTEIIDPTWTKLSKKELAEKLSKRLRATKPNKKRKHTYKSLIKYLKNGGTVSLETPKKALLVESLKNNRLPVISLCNKAFYKTIRKYKGKPNDIKGISGGHFVIVKGYQKRKFFIVDPLNKDYYKKEIDEDEFLFPWFYWGGWLLIIGK